MTIPIIDGETERLPEPEVPKEEVFIPVAWNSNASNWLTFGVYRTRERAVLTANDLVPAWSHPTIIRVTLGGER